MIETDKTRDVRRGASRFSRQIKQSGHKFKLFSGLNGGAVVAGGDFVFLEKSKKERMKRLSAVNRGSTSYEEKCEMMVSDVSDREEEELASQAPSTSSVGTDSKRFKVPRKQFLDDCNGVDHASVPRKLRSAMKKRNRESISPPFQDSKKLDNTTGGVESSKRDGVKKSKLNVKHGVPDWSLKDMDCGPITKDEEEVVETLYALKGMFPDNEPKDKTKLDSSLDTTPSALPEASETPPSILEDSMDIKGDLNSICLPRTDETADPSSNVEKLSEETINSLNEPSVEEPCDLPSSKKLCGELGNSVAQLNLQTMLAKQEEHKPPCRTVNFCIPPELYQDMGKLKQPTELETLLPDRKLETALGLTTAIGHQPDQQHTINEFKKNGPALWPGLSSTVSSVACSHGPSSQSSAAKTPTQLDTTLPVTGPSSFQNSSSVGKVFDVDTGRRSWKRCAAHVYISHLIWGLKRLDSKGNLLMHPNQLRPGELLKQGVLMTINDFTGIRNGPNGNTSTSSLVDASKKNSNEARSSFLQHQRLHQDQPQAALASGAYTSHKQTFNFLSLLADGGDMEANNSFKRPGSGLEPLPQLQVPYVHLPVQHPTLMPFSMSQTRNTSSAYPHLPSTASQQAQLQLPSYLGSPFCGPRTTATALTKNQPQQMHQQQQQQLWAAQLAAQYRNAGTSTAMTQFQGWQNGKQSSPMLIPCAQAVITPKPSSLEIPGPTYPQIPQQQQQLMTISLPHARVKRQDHHLSSVYEEAGGGFRAGGALPLQLLCNERL